MLEKYILCHDVQEEYNRLFDFKPRNSDFVQESTMNTSLSIFVHRSFQNTALQHRWWWYWCFFFFTSVRNIKYEGFFPPDRNSKTCVWDKKFKSFAYLPPCYANVLILPTQ